MAYSWHVYRAMFNDQFKGYVYAHNAKEAETVWETFHGLSTYHDVDNEAGLTDSHQANRFDEMGDIEFYVTEPEEGGYVIFLSPDELVDHIIDGEHAHEAHVFYIHEE